MQTIRPGAFKERVGGLLMRAVLALLMMLAIHWLSESSNRMEDGQLSKPAREPNGN